MLSNNKTSYHDKVRNTNNWTWPNVQKEILSLLKNERLIHTKNDVSFTYDHSGMYANGKKLNSSQISKFNTVFYKHNIFKGHEFSFYKSQNHIVIVDDNINMEGIIKDMISKKHIASSKEKVLFEINGNTVFKNGKQVSDTDLISINTLLRNEGSSAPLYIITPSTILSP